LTPLYATPSRQAYLLTRQNRLCHCCGLAWHGEQTYAKRRHRLFANHAPLLPIGSVTP
jgi:hypothetical protein